MVYKNNLSLCNLNEIHLYLSHFKSSYIESIKIFRLGVTREMRTAESKNTYRKACLCINALKYQGLKGLLQHWEMVKCMMMPAYSFTKHKDRGGCFMDLSLYSSRILSQNKLESVERCFFKTSLWIYSIQCRSVLCEGCAPLTNAINKSVKQYVECKIISL